MVEIFFFFVLVAAVSPLLLEIYFTHKKEMKLLDSQQKQIEKDIETEQEK